MLYKKNELLTFLAFYEIITTDVRSTLIRIFLKTMGSGDKNQSSWSAYSLAWELGYSIAVPLVALALGGRLLDKKLGTTPWLLIVGILFSIIISSYIVYKKTTDVMNEK